MAQAHGLAWGQPADQTTQILIVLIRLPRVLCRDFRRSRAGAGRTAMQGLFRIPWPNQASWASLLCEPGALIAIAFGTYTFLALPAFAFAGALAAVLIILGLSYVFCSSGQTTV
jgi:ABC-type Fe3+-siderophore transport system permease subunit